MCLTTSLYFSKKQTNLLTSESLISPSIFKQPSHFLKVDPNYSVPFRHKVNVYLNLLELVLCSKLNFHWSA